MPKQTYSERNSEKASSALYLDPVPPSMWPLDTELGAVKAEEAQDATFGIQVIKERGAHENNGNELE